MLLQEDSMPDSTPDPIEIDQLLESRPRRPKGLVIAGLSGLIIFAAVMLARSERHDDREYKTVTVERRNIVATVSATGNLKPTDQVNVGSEVSGIVAEVLADTNDRVVKGQILALIDTSKLEQQAQGSRAALLSADASLAQAQATQREADADLARFEEVHRLSDGRVPSKTELDAARATKLRADAAVKVAEAEIANSKASVLASEIDLEKSVIRSPIDGIVLDRWIEPGQTVAASFQTPVLFTIGQDLRQMDLTVYVSEADVGQVKEGQTASFTVDAWPDSEFEAVVKKVSFGSQTIENVVSYEAKLKVANEDLKLRPGMTATASIQVAERQGVLVVSNAALRFRPPSPTRTKRGFSLLPKPPTLGRSEPLVEGSAVYVPRESGLTRVSVDVGLSDGQWTEVSAPDLSEGVKVVVEMLEKAS
jgi:HlyD family secretion protein